VCEDHGPLLAVVVTAATRNEMAGAAATLDAVVLARPKPDEAHLWQLCRDAGDDAPIVQNVTASWFPNGVRGHCAGIGRNTYALVMEM
jgi:hypothetical protein